MAKALVYGAGISGIGASGLLTRLGYEVHVYDDAAQGIKGYASVDYAGAAERMSDYSILVYSPSVRLNAPLMLLAEQRGVTLLSEVELAYRNTKSDIIAVTGTNGKTTTTGMIEYILNECGYNALALGNIGVSFSGAALELDYSDVAVLELSSFQLEKVGLLRPKIAVLLNITPDHLERHVSMEAYAAAKANITVNQGITDYLIVNRDDEYCMKIVRDSNARVIYFSAKGEVDGVYAEGESVYCKSDGMINYLCARDEIKCAGGYEENALAALAVASVLSLPKHAAVRAVKNYKLPKYRNQLIMENDGKKYFNDSKSTNESSVRYAVNSMEGKSVLIMGGYDKGIDYTDLFADISERIAEFIFVGKNKDKLYAQAKSAGCGNLHKADELYCAVALAKAFDADNVLFSPATSSYDAYPDYIARGQAFDRIVMELCGEKYE